MKIGNHVLCAGLAGLLGACANPNGDGGNARTLSVPMQAGQQNLGATGQATLLAQGEQTEISFFISDPLPLGVTRPPTLYAFIYPGFCAKPAPQSVYQMNSMRANAVMGGWTFGKMVPVTLDKLRVGNYSIGVRTSPQDRNIDIFCGDIK
ncbi:MAG: hypothetical protein JNK92_05700 [Dechloromonas sp.]|nr:hypothetical protein [Dechloromonas sp.]